MSTKLNGEGTQKAKSIVTKMIYLVFNNIKLGRERSVLPSSQIISHGGAVVAQDIEQSDHIYNYKHSLNNYNSDICNTGT